MWSPHISWHLVIQTNYRYSDWYSLCTPCSWFILIFSHGPQYLYLAFESNPIHWEIYSWFVVYTHPKGCLIGNLWNWLHLKCMHCAWYQFCFFCLATIHSTSIVLCVYNTGKYTRLRPFVQLTPEYKTTLNIKTSCWIAVDIYLNIHSFVYSEFGKYWLDLRRNKHVLTKCNSCVSAIQWFYIQ